MTAIVEMARPQACAAAGTASLLGSHLGGAPMTGSEPWVAAVAVLLVVACCNIVNDVVDVTADSVDRPDRPLVSGRTRVSVAMVVAPLSAVGGLLAAFTMGMQQALAATGFLAAGVVYSVLVRRVPLLGHLWVAVMFGGTVLWGGWATAGIAPAVWAAGILVGLFVLPREMLKSLGDVRGDSVSGWRTAAVVLGTQPTMWAITATALLFSVATIGPVLSAIGGPRYLVVILLGTVIPLLAVVAWLWQRLDGRLRQAEFLTGLLWFPGLAALWLLGAAS